MTSVTKFKWPQATTLESVLSSPRNNNFNLIRLFLALAVLYTHSFLLFNANGHEDVLNYIFKDFDSGIFAVSGFFLISGMLLAQSFHSSNDRLKFILNRLFRIFPALIVCVLLTIFIFGALGSEFTLSKYYSSRGTFRYLYNIFLSNDYFIFNIPGSFEANYFPKIINGSLWTLPFELLCYITLFLSLSVIYFLIFNRGRMARKIFVIALVAFLFVFVFSETLLRERLMKLFFGTAESSAVNDSSRLYLFFFSGTILYHLRKYVSINFGFLLLLFALMIIKSIYFPDGPLSNFIEYLTVVYFILFCAGYQPLFKYNWRVDPSYGIYLYAWPIQQIVSKYTHLTSYQSMLITIPAAFVLGCISYVVIERPSLAVSHKLAVYFKSKREYKKAQRVENFEYS